MMSFRLKVILGIALLEILALAGLVGTSVYFLRATNEQSFTQRFDAEADKLSVLIRDAVVASDLAALDAVGALFMTNPDSQYLRIRDNQRVLIDLGSSPPSSIEYSADLSVGSVDDGVFDVQKVIYVDEFPIGFLELGTSTAAFEKVLEVARDRLIVVALMALILVVLTSWLIGVVLTRDLRNLRNALNEIVEGNTDLQLGMTASSEFRGLAHTFNRMARALSQREAERDVAVSEATENARRLAVREQRLAALLDTITDGVLIVDGELQIIEMNSSAECTLGLTQHALTQQGLTCLLDDPIQEQRLRSSLIQLDHEADDETRLHLGRIKFCVGTSVIWVELSVARLWENQHRQFALAFRDLTSELAIQAELERRERLKEALSTASPDAIFVLDGQNRVVDANPGAAKMFQQKIEQLRGQPLLEAITLVEGGDDLLTQLASKPSEPQSIELNQQTLVARRKDGVSIPLSFTHVPVQLGEQRLVTLVLRDLTERKQTEQSLLAAKDAAEKASQAKSDFLAHVTHEIRSPLNVMLGCVELLGGTELSYRQRLYTESAEQSAGVLLGLINNILDFARIESGAVELSNEPFDLLELCESVLAVEAFRLSDRQIDLGMLYDPSLPTLCRGDEFRLRQVLLNLIDNAIKFTQEGGVVLQVVMQPGTADQFSLECTVSDSGIGIPRTKQAEIFEAFTQVDSTDATLHGGAGLGLSICYRLVEAMGGAIQLDSTLGQGSTFSFAIPLGVVEAAAASTSLTGRVWVVTDNRVMGAAMVKQFALLGLQAERHKFAYAEEPSAEVDWVFVDVQLAKDPAIEQHLNHIHESGGRIVLMARRKWLAEYYVEGQADYFAVIEQPVRYSRLVQVLQQGTSGQVQAAPSKKHQGQVMRTERILLAEDSEANQLVAMNMLEQAGFQVEVANNGHEVLMLLAEQAFDLILMDMRMPRMDGLEATRRIRESATAYADIPIVALTANAGHADTQRCLAAGMRGFLGKPFTREALVQAIDDGLLNRDSVETGEHSMTALKLMDEAVLARLAQETSDAMLDRMISLFVIEAQKRVDAIAAHFASLDCHGVEIEAHTLKSNAATFGAAQLAVLAREIESACKRMEPERVQQLLPEVGDTLRDTLQCYRQRFNIAVPA
ncbi:response regulator [uncultured Pseudomonas sp.]|uniref:response regulator n=1 Tax=uncultured Pseudomonas sp. TaxID=114707 RepID=UPI0026347547|nr:response regulator [uncultured Pseudomonas sp.]